MDDRIVWQPVNLNNPLYPISILLDPGFAKEMILLKIPLWAQERINEFGKESLKKSGIKYDEPYQFYRDTSFVKRFHLGKNGIWLGFSGNLAEQSFSGPLIYKSQGIDSLSRKKGLLDLVDLWIDHGPDLNGISACANLQ